MSSIKDLDNNLGKRMKRIRESAGMNQTELGNLFSTGKRTVSDYEIGKIVPRLDYLIKFCTYFDISLDSLVNIESYKSKQMPAGIRITDLNDDEMELVKKYRTLNTDYQQKALQVISVFQNSSNDSYINKKAE